MSDPNQRPHLGKSVDQTAVEWLARRDRGLAPAEQDDYLQWLREDASHGEALARHESTLRRMMCLGGWQPLVSDEPNPDLFVIPRRRAWRSVVAGVGLTALLILNAVLWWPENAARPVSPADSFLRINQREVLPDGSFVELKDNSRISVEFSSQERRVKLVGGEAYFTVMKSAVPFVVVANGVVVRAVGTAFNVRRDAANVEVLVTQGSVVVSRAALNASIGEFMFPAGSTNGSKVDTAPAEVRLMEMPLTAGQRAVVAVSAMQIEPLVMELAPDEMKSALGWQGPRLQFFETPLAVAVAEFNKRSGARTHSRLVLGDPDLGRLPIGGTFRVDNVEGFVRLLEVTLDIRSEPRGNNELVLTRRK